MGGEWGMRRIGEWETQERSQRDRNPPQSPFKKGGRYARCMVAPYSKARDSRVPPFIKGGTGGIQQRSRPYPTSVWEGLSDLKTIGAHMMTNWRRYTVLMALVVALIAAVGAFQSLRSDQIDADGVG